jgi:hypothetical protein
MSRHDVTAWIGHNVTVCANPLALSSFIQFILGGKLVFSEQVADLHILFLSTEWYKCVSLGTSELWLDTWVPFLCPGFFGAQIFSFSVPRFFSEDCFQKRIMAPGYVSKKFSKKNYGSWLRKETDESGPWLDSLWHVFCRSLTGPECFLHWVSTLSRMTVCFPPVACIQADLRGQHNKILTLSIKTFIKV